MANNNKNFIRVCYFSLTKKFRLYLGLKNNFGVCASRKTIFIDWRTWSTQSCQEIMKTKSVSPYYLMEFLRQCKIQIKFMIFFVKLKVRGRNSIFLKFHDIRVQYPYETWGTNLASNTSLSSKSHKLVGLFALVILLH